jgi:exonuclease III
VRFNVCRGHLTVIGVYAPEEGKMEETEIFYDTLQKQVQNCTNSGYVIVAGDLNARVGKQPIPNTTAIFGENHMNKTTIERICYI